MSRSPTLVAVTAGLWLSGAAAAAGDRLDVRPLAGPATVAFSPDSSQLAVTDGDGVHTLTRASGEWTHTMGLGVRSLAWGDALYIVHGVGDASGLATFDPATGMSTPVGGQPYLVRVWAPLGAEPWLLTARAEQTRIGVATQMSVRSLDGDPLRPAYSWDPLLRSLEPVPDFAWGWMSAAPGAMGLALPTYHDPPQDQPFISFDVVNLVTGAATRLAKEYVQGFVLSVAPCGGGLVRTDESGRLWALSGADGQWVAAAEDAPRGRFPACDPAGERVVLGGWLMALDGSGARRLVRAGEDSVATWSPDGRAVVVVGARSASLVSVAP